jgi:hypothetical protein
MENAYARSLGEAEIKQRAGEVARAGFSFVVRKDTAITGDHAPARMNGCMMADERSNRRLVRQPDSLEKPPPFPQGHHFRRF